jgi:hypothetical protein
MQVTDEKLIEFLDGELSDQETRQLELLLKEDQSLQQRLAAFRQVDHRLTEVYESIDNRPYPPAVLKMLSDARGSRSTDADRSEEPATSLLPGLATLLTRLFSRPAWASATAACALILGVLFGSQLGRQSETGGPAAVEITGVILPGSPLYSVLERNLSNQSSRINENQSTIATPILTFRAIDTRYCREFTVATAAQGSRGIACRENGNWHLEMLARDDSLSAASGQFTTASGSSAVALDVLFNTLAAGAPLDANFEASLIDSSWAQ